MSVTAEELQLKLEEMQLKIAQLEGQNEELRKLFEISNTESGRFNSELLIENAPDGITLITEEGKIKYASPSARRIFGYDSTQITSIDTLENTHPEDLPHVLEALVAIMNDPSLIRVVDYRFKSSDGSWKWIESTLTNKLNTPGLESIVFNFREITKRKNAEQALRVSEEKFRMLLDLATDAFFQGDTQGNLITVNNKACELTGYSKSELLGFNISKLFSKDELQKNPLMYERLLAGETVRNERQIIRKDKTQVTIEMNSRAMPDGTFQTFVRDITERKKIEEELERERRFFEQVFEQSSTSTQILDPDGWCLRVNPRFCEMLGVDAEDIEGKKNNIFREGKVFLNGNEDQLRNVFNNHCIEEWEIFFDIGLEASKLNLKCSSDKQAWFVNKAYPILDKDGKLLNVIIQHEDISERKQAEEALRLKEEQLLSVINGTQDIICFKDGSGRWLQANQADLELFELTDVDYYLKKDSELAEFTHKAYYEAFMNCEKSDEQAWAKGSVLIQDEYIPDAKGNIRIFETIKTPLFNSDGSRKGLVVFGRDVSATKKAIEALKESEDKFRTLAESAPYAIMIYQDDHWVYANPAGERITGYSADELNQMNFWNIAADDYREMVKERGQKRQTGVSTTPSYEFKIRTKTGEEKWVFLSGRSLLFNGKMGGLISAVDITDRKLAEDAVHRERRLLRTLIDNLPDTIYFKDNDCRKIVANRADLMFLGISDESMALGKTDIDLFGVEKGTRGHEDDLKVIQSGQPLIDSENDVTDAEGRPRWLLTSKIPLFDEQGEVNGLVGIGHDITERRRAEKIQRVLFQISNAVLITNDLEQLFKIIWEQLSTLVDTTNFFIAFYDEETDMLTTPFFKDEKDVSEPWPAEKSATGYVIKNKKSLLADMKLFRSLEEKGLIMSYGQDCQIWLGVPLLVNDKAIGAIVVQSYNNPQAYSQKDVEMLEFISHQISLSIQRKMTEQDLLVALAKAEESDRLKTAFLNNMSHEIRTPLNGILGFTSLLNDPDIDADEQQYFHRIIEQNGQQLLSIINDIINIATIEAGQEKVRSVDVDVNAMLDLMYTQFKIQSSSKQLMLNFKTLLSNDEAIIKTDETKLMQILTNLIGNALKFTDKGVVEFGVSRQKQMLEFYVSDTGIGIAPELHNVIFERFRQANSSLTKEYGGNGLGLAITKAYVNLLGGEIWLESSAGKGSTFYFSIPYEPVSPKTEGPAESTEQAISVSGHHGREKTLLVAEDVYANYQLLEAILKRKNYHIIHVENGIEAIEACKNNPEIDLVLMDMKMPEMDGYQATSIIKIMRPHLPVVAVTAYALGGDKEKALNAGCDDYITKPVKAANLLEILDRYLHEADV